jgi:purine-cytosine permease-like protein
MPVDTPRYKIFWATYVGIFVPTVLVQTLGAALYSGTLTNPEWKEAHNEFGVGGLLKMALEPAGGFGKFLMVLAGLSAIPVRQTSIGPVEVPNVCRTTSRTTTPLPSTHKTSAHGH